MSKTYIFLLLAVMFLLTGVGSLIVGEPGFDVSDEGATAAVHLGWLIGFAAFLVVLWWGLYPRIDSLNDLPDDLEIIHLTTRDAAKKIQRKPGFLDLKGSAPSYKNAWNCLLGSGTYFFSSQRGYLEVGINFWFRGKAVPTHWAKVRIADLRKSGHVVRRRWADGAIFVEGDYDGPGTTGAR